ncbi:phenylacetate--CoA ligase family protein [Rubneribacter sp.]|nr:phenylacetate--CoA ligase [Candidatus Rubneribacter avistercoris]
MAYQDEITHMDRAELEALQLERLKKAVVYCYEKIPFYKENFDAVGFDPYALSSFEDLRKASFTTKDDMRAAYPYGLFALPKEEVKEIHMSSGTTGVATVSGYTEHDLQVWGDCFARGIGYAGGTEEDICHVCYGYGLFTGGLGAHYGGLAAGCMTIPMSSGNTKRQIKVLNTMGSSIICCTPSYAMYIADTAIADGFDPKKDFKLKAGIHGAEAWSNQFRENLEEKLGYKALDVYGLTEIMGPGVAMECLEQNGLHVAEDHFFAEILDPETHEPVPDGEWGELVITTLDKEATPVIRYRTKDITRIIPGVCACGRTHRRIDRLHGRTDDMMIIRGVNVFPSQIENVCAAFPEVADWYQIELTRENSLDVATLKIEINPEFPMDEIRKIEDLQKRVKQALKDELATTIQVKIVEPYTIQRSEGKAVRIVDLRSEEEK